MTVQFDWHARPGPRQAKAQLTALALRLHILLLFLEFPELRLDGDGGLLCLRVLHVDVEVLRDVALLLICREKRDRRVRRGLRFLSAHVLFCAAIKTFQAVLMTCPKLMSHLPFWVGSVGLPLQSWLNDYCMDCHDIWYMHLTTRVSLLYRLTQTSAHTHTFT